MNKKRFELSEYSTVYRYSVIDNIQKGTLKANEIIILLSKQAEKIGEQQATIRRLQDLCGESDGENAKLRIENKRLQKELNDCEKFRYTVFKRLNDEHIKECSIK